MHSRLICIIAGVGLISAGAGVESPAIAAQGSAAAVDPVAAAKGIARYPGGRSLAGSSTAERRDRPETHAARTKVPASGGPVRSVPSAPAASRATAAPPATVLPSETPPAAARAGQALQPADGTPQPADAPSAASPSPTASNAETPAPGESSTLIGPPPPLTLSSRQAVVPLGERRTLTLTGALQAPELNVTPGGVLTADLTPGAAPGAWKLALRGDALGEAVVQVALGDQTETITARVLKYAGHAASASIEVTGQPASAEWVLREARTTLEGAMTREPGAVASIGSPAVAPPELAAGQAVTLSFPVTISGPDLLSVKTEAAVTVRNRDLEPRDVGELLYSNDPERVEHPGTLFAAELSPERPARLLYHHLNAGAVPLQMRLALINPTAAPVDLQVIEGSAGPTPDAVEAGHRAAVRYIRSDLLEIGRIVRVPANSQETVALQRLPPGATVSGLFGLRALGAGLFVQLDAGPADEPAAAVQPAQKPAQLSDDVYLSPSRPVKARFVVGQSWTFVNLGSDPVQARGSRKKLAGNYGVSYEMAFDLSNPTDQPQIVALVLSPDAGDARGVFVIDGAVVEAPPVAPPVEADLARFHLLPGERRLVRVQTLPVGGSSYPARLVLRTASPIRSARAEPPINTDGHR